MTLENIGLTPHNTFLFLGPLVSWPASGSWDRSCTKSVLIARCQDLLTCRRTLLLIVNKAFSFLTSVSFNKRFLSEAVLSPEFLYVRPVCELEYMCSQLGESWIIDSALLSMDLSPNVSIRTTGRAYVGILGFSSVKIDIIYFNRGWGQKIAQIPVSLSVEAIC